jgi:acyl carrier protein phosphodiesterase
MISDFVKGKKKFHYTPGIQKGIQLHRDIDQYTDSHPITRQAKQFFIPDYRLYAGAFIDIVYDHFLANDRNEFENDTLLNRFCQESYNVLSDYLEQLPLAYQKMFPYMQSQNWLYHYKEKPGMEKSFKGLARKATYLTESERAFNIFNTSYTELGDCYRAFFPELKEFTIQQMNQLMDS